MSEYHAFTSYHLQGATQTAQTWLERLRGCEAGFTTIIQTNVEQAFVEANAILDTGTI